MPVYMDVMIVHRMGPKWFQGAFVASAMLLLTGPIQAHAVSLRPFVGFRFGGDFATDGSGGSADLDESASFGFGIAWPLTEMLWEESEVEILYSRQDSTISGDAFGGPDGEIDFAVDHILLGVRHYYFDESLFEYPWIQTYVSGYVGATHFSSGDGSVESATRPAIAGALGADFSITERTALFFEGRGFATFSSDGSRVVCQSGRCAAQFDGNTFLQGEVSVGFIVRF
jgi:hypothetical protein